MKNLLLVILLILLAHQASASQEKLGITGNKVANKSIKTYPVKNSGEETVTKLNPVADLS